MDNCIMVLPGTVGQIPLIKRIKELGYRVAVVHPYPDAPAFKYADEKVYSDILDREAVLAAARRLGVVAVMSDECDIATPTLAYVSSQMGLPSQTEPMARLYTDKSLMRDFCRDHGLPCPDYKVCETVDEAVAFYQGLKARSAEADLKMVIKPIDANSSRGVFTIQSEEQLISLFDQSIAYSHHRHAVICEQFISGAEFSVDGIRLPQGHVCLAISEKTQFPYNKNLDNYLYFSYTNPRYDYDRLRAVNNQFVELSGLPFGFTHAEYRYENGQFYLLEIGARGGGGLLSSHVVPALTGIDNYKILIDMFVGNPVTTVIDPQSLRNNRVAMVKFFDTSEEGGVVKNIKGRDFLDAQPSILHWQLNFKEGDRIKRPTDGGNRIGYYIACTDGPDAMTQLEEQVDNHFVIEYE